jgi:phage shock protein PspC (stress-responsive transcriptional regulator)
METYNGSGIASPYSDILGVLGGQESFKLDVGLVKEDIIYIGLAIFIAILLAYVIGNLILKSF